MLGKKHNAAGETAVEKPLRGKVPNQTFPPSLEIAQRTRDSHFPPAAATAGLRLHFQCLDDRPQGYIFKWLDTTRHRGPPRGVVQRLKDFFHNGLLRALEADFSGSSTLFVACKN